MKISSTNADSLLSFYRAARANGMGFYAPDHVLEQMKLFEEMSESSYFSYCYTPSWPILHRNESENTCEKYKRAFNAQRSHMREEGFVAVVSEYDEDLFEEFADLDPIRDYVEKYYRIENCIPEGFDPQRICNRIYREYARRVAL